MANMRLAYSASVDALKKETAPQQCTFIVTNKNKEEVYKDALEVNTSVRVHTEASEAPYTVTAVGQGLTQVLNDPNSLVMTWIGEAASMIPTAIVDPQTRGSLWIGYSGSVGEVKKEWAPSPLTFTIQDNTGKVVHKVDLQINQSARFKANDASEPYTVTAEGQGLTQVIEDRHSTVFTWLGESADMIPCRLVNPLVPA